jgi:hypothetical protein
MTPPNSGEMQSGNLEFRGLLRTGGARYAHRFTALNVGLQAGVKRGRTGGRLAHKSKEGETPTQKRRGSSDPNLRLSAIRPSSGSERAFIFRISLLR